MESVKDTIACLCFHKINCLICELVEDSKYWCTLNMHVFRKTISFLENFCFTTSVLKLSLKNFRPQEAFQAFRRISKPGF